MGIFSDWLAKLRADKQAKLNAASAKAQKEAAERNANTARVTEQQRNAQALRGGVPPVDARRYEVVDDTEATYQAYKNREASPQRYRQKYGPRTNLTGAELPRLDTTAWDIARLTDPYVPLSDFWYWPDERK